MEDRKRRCRLEKRKTEARTKYWRVSQSAAVDWAESLGWRLEKRRILLKVLRQHLDPLVVVINNNVKNKTARVAFSVTLVVVHSVHALGLACQVAGLTLPAVPALAFPGFLITYAFSMSVTIVRTTIYRKRKYILLSYLSGWPFYLSIYFFQSNSLVHSWNITPSCPKTCHQWKHQRIPIHVHS